MLDTQRMKSACVQKRCPNELSNLMARSAFHKLLIAAIPQFVNAAFRHVVTATAKKCRNNAIRQDRNPAEREYRNAVTTSFDIAAMRHHRTRKITD